MERKDILTSKERFSSLLLIYGPLLSPTIQRRLGDFYLTDLSLSEIAQNESVSRSAVQQSIKEGEKALLEYEKKLSFLKKERAIVHLLGEVEKENDPTKRQEKIDKIKGELDYGI